MRRETLNCFMAGTVLLGGAALYADYEHDVFDALRDRNQPEEPSIYQGHVAQTGRERIGSVAQFVYASAEKDRALDKASGFKTVFSIRDIMLPELASYEQGQQGEALYLTRFDSTGEDAGFDVSNLKFDLIKPESDLSDGEDDSQCLTAPSDPRSRGCEIAGWAETGWLKDVWGVGADNNENLGYKLALAVDVFSTDKKCLFDYYIIPKMNMALEQYGTQIESVPGGDDIYTSAAKIIIRGALRLQEYGITADTFDTTVYKAGTPPQWITVHVVGKYSPGLTVRARFEQLAENSSQNIDVPDVPDDWCVSFQGEQAIEILDQDLALLAVMGLEEVPEGFNPETRQVDMSDERFKAPERRLDISSLDILEDFVVVGN